jgi:hypothetical protein
MTRTSWEVLVSGQAGTAVGGAVVGGADVDGTAVGTNGTVAGLVTVGCTLMDVAEGKLVAIFTALVWVAEIVVPVGKTVNVTTVAVLLDVVVGDAVLVSVLVVVTVLAAVTTMGVSDGTTLVLVAVLAVASAWAVKTIMVGI